MKPIMKVNDNLISDIEDTHSIVQFLARPVLIYDQDFKNSQLAPLNNFVITANDAQKPVFNLSLPWDVLKYGGKDCKVQKFEYFRADVKIKITINANNMTSGRFWLTYAPIDALIDSPYKITAKHRAGVTAYPGVEMDIQINNSVEMVIPYSHWAEAMSLTKTNASQSSFASLYLFPLTPLRSAGDYRITMQLWAWFENVSLTGPTPAPLKASASSLEQAIASQMGTLTLSETQRAAMIGKINALGGDYARIAANLQADAENGSVLRTVASAVNKAGEFADHFALGKEVSKPLSWIGDLMDNTANYFGWSRPANKQQLSNLANVPGQGFTHAEAIDNGTVLGLTQENLLSTPKDVFQQNVDEMDIEYVCRNPACVNSATWSKNTTMKVELIGLKVNPYADLKKSDPKTTAFYLSTAPVDYVASLFGLWRGTLCYRVTVTKTAYHSGRLEITFIPNQDGSLLSTIDTTNTYRYILDITNEAEVVIKIPFFSDAYMLPVGNDFGYTGRLVVRPITSLHCPDTVASTVDVQIWKWMEDCVFACPAADNLSIWQPTGFVPASMQIDDGPFRILQKAKNNVKFEFKDLCRSLRFYGSALIGVLLHRSSLLCAQGVGDDEKYTPIVEKFEARMQIQVANVVDRRKEVSFFKGSTISTPKVLSTVAGEAITNLRALTRCMRHSEDTLVYLNSKSYNTKDYTELNVFGDTTNDYIAYLKHMYRFARGGVNIKAFCNMDLPYGTNTSTYLAPTNSISLRSQIVYDERGKGNKNYWRTPEHITYVDLNPVHEVSIPYYSKYRCVPTVPVAKNETTTLAVGRPIVPTIRFSGWCPDSLGAYQSQYHIQMRVYRGGKDDFSFGALVGPPQLYKPDKW
uniref:Structural polyprotein n=1 Tax=PNG bee virus 8 TaxID=2746862 RepID=A0A7D4XIV6_9VIRU|nr:structural polyprotein [PNG bee virus 8]